MSPRALETLGKVGVAAAVTGVVTAAVMIAWPIESPAGLTRFPFAPSAFVAFQSWFFVHHLGLVAVLVAFAKRGPMGAGRVTRGFAWAAVVGMAILAINEIHAIGYAEQTLDEANRGALGAGYGVATNLVGIGALVSGVGVIRARVWTGWRRYVPVAIALVHFFFVTPALFSRGYVIARVAIATWVALFGALGWALVLDARRASLLRDRSSEDRAP